MQQEMPHKSADKVDVAVVGGGPGGLAAALGLIKHMPHLKVKVYEAMPKFVPQGAGVGMHTNGLRALQWLDSDTYDRMMSRGLRLGKAVWHDEHGKVTHEGTPGTAGPSAPELMLPWYAIRDTLYEALPAGTVQFGLRGTDVLFPEEGSEGPVTLILTSSSSEEEKHTVEAQLVVAADGYRSRLRELVMSDDTQLPSFGQRMVWRARSCFKPGQVPELLTQEGITSMWWSDSGKFIGVRVFLVYKVTEEEYVWTVIGPTHAIEAAGIELTGTDIGALSLSVQQQGAADKGSLERVRRILHDYPAEVLALLDVTDPYIVTQHAVVTHSCETLPKEWHKGRLLMIGDAAHCFPPTGQGCNTTLEDAAVLVDVLKHLGINQQALDIFEKQRYLRVRAILKNLYNSTSSITEQPFLPAALDDESIVDPEAVNMNKPVELATA